MSIESFRAHAATIEARPGYARSAAFAIGVATLAPSGKVLDTFYPAPNCGEHFGSAATLADICGHLAGTATYRVGPAELDKAVQVYMELLDDGGFHPNVESLLAVRAAVQAQPPLGGVRVAVVAFIGDLDDKPIDAHDVYLRLHLLSHRKVRPHGMNMDGVFGLLHNVVWTNLGPFDPDSFDLVRARLIAGGHHLMVHGLDKFPRMTDYVIPSGVRIADANRVRLGAHLAEGTTVMHEGFCNFNAGTLGSSMVEGRISGGVVVGNGSDIGGGASIMGTLSGGGKEVISIGEKCLLGANGGIGISLGDNCIVEAGCYVTAGSRLTLPDGTTVKGKEVSGQSNMLIRRNSVTGALELLPNGEATWTGLNVALHRN